MLLLSLATLVVTAGPAPTPTSVRAEPAPKWNARFAGKSGWVGGDVVASAVLGPDRVVWLFGDTLVGMAQDGGRQAVMVNNSVAVQTGRGKDVSLRFVLSKGADGKPRSFFLGTPERDWFWPQSAVRAHDKLYVFLARIERSGKPGAFGFRHAGQVLVVVANPDAEPEQWRTETLKLPFAEFTPKQERSWGSAVLVHDGFLYVYGYLDERKALGSRRLSVARMPTGKVEDFTAWRFRTRDGWGTVSEAAPLAGGLATEFSVGPAPGGKGFILVYTENGLSDRILARFADTPADPWSEPIVVYRCPEAKDKSIFTYAGKAHAWAARNGELLVSYCTNAWDFGRLFHDEAVYRPRFVRVQFERR